MKISFYTLGCKVNYAETQQIQDKFEKMGFEITDFENQSDIILINTCTVTNNADCEAGKVIRRARRNSPDSFIGVFGCFAQLKSEEILSKLPVNAVFGQKEKFKIPELVNEMINGTITQNNVSCIDDITFESALTSDNNERTRAFLKMQDGCNYNCTFCTIPLARGKSRSMDFDKIPEFFENIKINGYNEVVISGINLGDFRTKDGKNFTDVVRLIDKIAKNLRVRISSIEPNLLNDEILKIVSNSEVFCPHFHIPLQSGSDNILKKMGRRYNSTFYKELIFKIKQLIPDCGIGVDVISGFPNESYEDFQLTYDFLNGLPITYLHSFTYSERADTPAIKYPNPIPMNIRKQRTKALNQLSNLKKLDFVKEQIGKEKIVIPENQVNGIWNGWTENYIKVFFESTENIFNSFTKVKLLNIENEIAKGELIIL